MRIVQIGATEKELIFQFDEKIRGEVTICAYSPALRENLPLGEYKVQAEGDTVCTERFFGGRDGLYLRYMLYFGDRQIDGVKYVEKQDFPATFEYEYPVCDTKKGLQVAMIEDAIELGVRHAALNVCIGDLMRSAPSDSTITFSFDGFSYYFDKKAVEGCDRRIKELSRHDIIISLILLCSKHWSMDTPKDMYPALLHPDYDNEGTLSAFNVMTDEGIRHYSAFIAFLSRRYTDPAYEHGRAVGLIISNEVNSQWVWGNAGNKTAKDYTYEYTAAMRIASQVSGAIYRNMRIYISLDHFWTGSLDKNQPLRFYGSREVLENLNRNAKAEGDFYWNIAFHPYPEDLNYPDFWNDKTATFDNDTYRVTFKNLSVLVNFLYAEENLYHGVRRRVILSEQGFNSHWTMESELLQATAYGRAYRAVMEIPEIDSFILHAHCDNRMEFGLNLGLWRRERDGDKMEAPKPIYYVFKAIDRRDETGKFHWERY